MSRKWTPGELGEMAAILDDAARMGYGDDDSVEFLMNQANISYDEAYDFFRNNYYAA